MDRASTDESRGLGRALVVDDVAEARESVGRRLSEVGFTIRYAADGLDAFEAFVRHEPDLIVTDWQMPRLNGIGLVRRIREISDVPVLMITSFGSVPDCEQAMRVGVDRYLQFRHDLDRVGEVARQLMRDSAAKEGRISGRRSSPVTGDSHLGGANAGMTAAEARWLAQHELREELQKHLFDCRGNIAEMGRRMGKDRSTIRYHLRRLGMLDQKGNEPHQVFSRSSHRRSAD